LVANKEDRNITMSTMNDECHNNMVTSKLKEILEGPPASAALAASVVTAHLIVDLHCDLGEGILYDDITDTILWTDILGKKFHKLHLSTGTVQTFTVPKMLCSFAMLPEGQDGYLCAWEDGFQLYDVENHTELSAPSTGVDVLKNQQQQHPTIRLNDGRCDRDGRRFICGGFYGDVAGITVQVFKCEYNNNNNCDRALVHEPIVEEIEVTNSICFSLDGNTMYLADSPKEQIHSYSYDKSNGGLSNKTLLHTIKVPDGSCVDSEGYLWNAVWRGGEGPSCVHRIHPISGDIVMTVNVPDTTSQVSCCCFGGKDLNVLFITSAAVSRDATLEPHAGGLYAVKLDITGMKEARFIGR
jgi:L-arabinonolactonase